MGRSIYDSFYNKCLVHDEIIISEKAAALPLVDAVMMFIKAFLPLVKVVNSDWNATLFSGVLLFSLR